ncbi:hypothetical protein [Bacillus gaemokensis]|uniref:hypothetical protein n=1 Tax=Bacillus gaemokensis TaxID=574375 RepID=UPI000AEF456E|nr:hypothetical protein [Bacillus gaemokensis]
MDYEKIYHQNILEVLRISPSTYYYQRKKEEKSISERRPIPGYSFTKSGKKIAAAQVEN